MLFLYILHKFSPFRHCTHQNTIELSTLSTKVIHNRKLLFFNVFRVIHQVIHIIHKDIPSFCGLLFPVKTKQTFCGYLQKMIFSTKKFFFLLTKRGESHLMLFTPMYICYNIFYCRDCPISPVFMEENSSYNRYLQYRYSEYKRPTSHSPHG